MRLVLSILPRLWTNWVTLIGSIITTVAGCTLVLALAADLLTPAPKPYASAFVLLVAPAVFALGLLLIPLGLYWQRRRKPTTGAWTTLQAAFDTAFQDRTVRRGVFLVGVATLANIALMGAVGSKALIYLDSVSFCGTACHSVMEPEYEAYRRSPHQRVACVDCHIGSGATWAARSKISGLRQVWAVTVGSHSRPIPTPVDQLRPARDTCEQCHWPAKFHGNRLRFYTHYDDDAANTESVTAVLLKVGGVDPKSREYRGIHWHVSPDTEVRYEVLDRAREKIGKVTVVQGNDEAKVFRPPGEPESVREIRTMDCVDCHNRPTHIFDQTAQFAVDRAFLEGRLDSSVPFLHKVAVSLLEPDDRPRAGARERFRSELARAYAGEHPDVEVTPAQLAAAAAEIAELYLANIFPDMGVGWDAYPSHLGHRGEKNDVRGCFRCHNDEHATGEGELLSQDCDLCHEILHEQEPTEALDSSLTDLFKPEE